MGAAATVSVDAFQALEQKVLQAVELLNKLTHVSSPTAAAVASPLS